MIKLFMTEQFSIAAAPPTITSHANFATINQDENDESMTAVSITLEGEKFQTASCVGYFSSLL